MQLYEVNINKNDILLHLVDNLISLNTEKYPQINKTLHNFASLYQDALKFCRILLYTNVENTIFQHKCKQMCDFVALNVEQFSHSIYYMMFSG